MRIFKAVLISLIILDATGIGLVEACPKQIFMRVIGGLQTIGLLPKRNPDKPLLENEIREMKSALETVAAKSRQAGLILQGIKADSAITKKKLDRFSNEVLLKLGNLDIVELATQFDNVSKIWSDISKMSEEQLDAMGKAQDSAGKVIDNFAERSAQNLANVKGAVESYKKELEATSNIVKSNVAKFAETNLAIQLQTKQLKMILKKMNIEMIDPMKKTQKHEIERFHRIATENLRQLETLTDIFLNDTTEVNRNAEKLLSASNDLKTNVSITLGDISSAMSQTINQQLRLELLMKFSGSVNRINFLRNWFQEISDYSDDQHEIDKEKIEWARAVIEGHPADRPIEEHIVDIVTLVCGKLPLRDEHNYFHLAGIDSSTTLLDIFNGNVKILTESQENHIVYSLEEAKRFLEINSRNSDLGNIKQSESYFLQAFGEQILRVHLIAGSMATQARLILDTLVKQAKTISHSHNRRYRRAISELNERERSDLNTALDIIRHERNLFFHNLSNILAMASELSQIQIMSFEKVLNDSSLAVRQNIPLVSHVGNLSIYERQFFIGEGNQMLSLGTVGFSNNRERGMMITGCRFCTRKRCGDLGSSKLVDDFKVFVQCSSKSLPNPNEKVAAQSTDVILPKADQVFDRFISPKLTTVAEGPMHVNNPLGEFVCGIELKYVIFNNEMPLGLSIQVCSRYNGTYVYTKDPEPSSSNPQLTLVPIKAISYVNALWVRQSDGWTIGAGLYLSQHRQLSTAGNLKDKTPILNIQLESSYF